MTYGIPFLVAQTVRNLPAMLETQVQFLGWEDPLEEEMAVPSPQYILVWRIPWTEEPGRLQSMGSQRVRHSWTTKHLWDPCILKQHLALPAGNLGPAPRPGFIHNSPRVFWTLTLLTSEPAQAPQNPQVLQPAISWQVLLTGSQQ